MKGYYKLHDLVKTPTDIKVAHKRKGMVQNARQRLSPGKVYSLHIEEDDDDGALFRKSLESDLNLVRRRETPELKAALEKQGIEYKRKICKQCSGSVAKLEYRVIEIVEEGELDGK